MGPSRKRQRLSEDGTAAVTATADTEQPVNFEKSGSKQDSRKQLFVRSLAPTVTTTDLTEYFSESYPIKHALVVLDRESKESKGYGFVTFADAEDALRAKEELDGTELKGKKIWVDVAESRHRGDTALDVPGLKGLPSAATKAKLDREQQRNQDPTPKLIIRNLPWSIKKPDQLEKLFLSYGKVHFATLPKKPTGELKGFGFVALRGRKNAEKAMEELNGKIINGRPIAVDWAVNKDTWQQLQQQEARPEETEEQGSDDAAADAEESDEESAEESSEGSEDTDSEVGSDDLEDGDNDNDEGGVELDNEEEEEKPKRAEHTVFIRNLPFTADDETLDEHFTQFGRIRFARIVVDRETERPKGTGFVCFVREEDMIECLKGAPRVKLQKKTSERRDGTSVIITHSVLEDEDADPTGKYTMDGRILQITRAVDRNEATRLTTEGHELRFNRDKDKRHLYLLSEGTIASNSPLYQKLAPSEIKMREDSATQRKRQIQDNPSLHLSLTRLSVRNIPRSVTSKDLKELARKAIVGFSEDMKTGKREKLSKEEISRNGEADFVAEKIRKKRGKGIVKQAKIVFETPAGSKVDEKSGAGRSRGYGFIEYYTHRNALMALRWLNGHAVEYRAKGDEAVGKKLSKQSLEDKKKRLIVEFAIENANVVARRSDREAKSREHPQGGDQGEEGEGEADANGRTPSSGRGAKGRDMKRKRDDASVSGSAHKKGKGSGQGTGTGASAGADGGNTEQTSAGKAGEKLAKHSRIIAKKRQMRRAKKAGKA